MGLRVKFWGVRGSIACPSPNHIHYGGNTSCVEVTASGRHIILDAGTGIRALGHSFMNRDARNGLLLLTHTHWDHINGFPFFGPAFNPRFSFHIMAGHLIAHGGIQQVLASQMTRPMFPVPLEAMKATLTFEDFAAGDGFDLEGGIRIRTCILRHPDGATGYRIEHGGKAVCFITDTEHVPGKPDENVLALIEGADLVIYDCTYTDDEFPAKVGWGHSTWQEGIRLCRMANVGRLAIFHHDPEHDDAFMAAIEKEAVGQWAGALVARDNMELDVG
ncbi:MAG: MBL fold metallo-hydrolase [Rhodospirillales bacterium]|nr:MBL fold metallo-hydrolase [Rhodospirillales bacterium]